MKKIIIVTLIIFFSCALAAEEEGFVTNEEVERRIKEIEKYEKFDGVWEGRYFPKSLPIELEEHMAKNGNLSTGLKIKIEVKGRDVKVSHMGADVKDWKLLTDERTSYFFDEITAVITSFRQEGVWMEKWIFMISRNTEKEGILTSTRIVHNWAGEYEGDRWFYSVYSEGKVSKIKSY